MNKIGTLLSYPRSGNSWLRYCIENTSNIKTVGENSAILIDKPVVNNDSELLLQKKHSLKSGDEKYPLICLVRDYKEAVRSAIGGVEGFKKTYKTKGVSYHKVISDYHNHPGPKMMIYYEDLVKTPDQVLEQVLTFLNKDQLSIEDFLESIDDHKIKSFERYHSSEATWTDTGDNLYHFKNQLSEDERASIDEYIESSDPEIYNFYLSRYKG